MVFRKSLISIKDKKWIYILFFPKFQRTNVVKHLDFFLLWKDLWNQRKFIVKRPWLEGKVECTWPSSSQVAFKAVIPKKENCFPAAHNSTSESVRHEWDSDGHIDKGHMFYMVRWVLFFCSTQAVCQHREELSFVKGANSTTYDGTKLHQWAKHCMHILFYFLLTAHFCL